MNLTFTDIKDQKDTRHIVDTVRVTSVQAVENTLQTLDLKSLEAAVDVIDQANTIKIFGVGASAIVGQDLSFKLMRIGLNAIFTSDLHVQLTSAATMDPDDLAIIITNSGVTSEMLEIQNLASQNGTSTIAITSLGKNLLSQKADIVLTTSSPEMYLRSGAMSSRIAQLAVLDTLFTTLANKHYDKIELKLDSSYMASLPDLQAK